MWWLSVLNQYHPNQKPTNTLSPPPSSRPRPPHLAVRGENLVVEVQQRVRLALEAVVPRKGVEVDLQQQRAAAAVGAAVAAEEARDGVVGGAAAAVAVAAAGVVVGAVDRLGEQAHDDLMEGGVAM